MDFDFGMEASDSFFSRLQRDSNSRNLSQIFEDDLLPLRKESRNLRYQPGANRPTPSSTDSSLPSSTSSPVVPSSSNAAQRQSSPWAVIFAKVIVVYEGQHPLDRMGLALSMLGQNEAVNMIIYKHKNKTISNTKLKPNGFKLHLRDSYLQFYDDNRKYWSVHFVKKADETEFIEIMTENELPFEHHTSRSDGDGSVEQQQRQHQARQHREQEEQPADHKEHRRHHTGQQQDPRPVAPQPMPRSRSLATDSYLAQRLDPDQSPHPPSDKSNAISEEDVIVTPVPRPIGSTSMKDHHVGLEDDDSGSPLVLSSSRTEVSAVSVFPMQAEGILRAIRQLANGRGLSEDSTAKADISALDDAEDRMLAMEQDLLDMKKKNRALVKSLRQREQDLIDVQASSVAMLEKLLSNQSLSEKKPLLVDSPKEERRSRLAGEQPQSSASVAPSSSCANCERAAKEITFLKRHISALKVALREPASDI